MTNSSFLSNTKRYNLVYHVSAVKRIAGAPPSSSAQAGVSKKKCRFNHIYLTEIAQVAINQAIGIEIRAGRMELNRKNRIPESHIEFWTKLKSCIVALPFVVAACASNVPVPNIPSVDNRTLLSLAEDEAVERIVAEQVPARIAVPKPPAKAQLPKTGEKTSYGVVVTGAYANAIRQQYTGENESAIEALRDVTNANGQNLNLAFEAAYLEAQNLMALGRFDEAEAAILRAERFERQLFKTNVNSRAVLGEIKFWASDVESATTILNKVVAATVNWNLPTSYGGPPTNLPELFDLTTAQLRAYTTLAAIYLTQNDFESAAPWAAKAEKGYADVFYVSYHPIYGPFVPTHADSYYGRALNLAVLGGTALVLEKNRKTAEEYFQAAHVFLDAIGFASPALTVDAIKAQSLLAAGYVNEAASLANALTTTASEQGQADLVWRIETLKGEALLQAGDKAAAEQSFRTAQSAVNVVIGRLALDRSKRRFGVGKDTVTYHLANLDIQRNDMSALFQDLERGRARAFVDMLAANKAPFGREKEIADKIETVDRKIRAQRLKLAAPLGKSSANVRTARTLLETRNNLVDALRKNDPELADIYAVSTTTLKKVQQRLGQNDVLLYAVPGQPKDSVRWLEVGRRNAGISTLNLTHDELKIQLKKFRATVNKSGTALTEQSQILAQLARAFEIEKWGQKDAVYIVPSGQLYFIPWGALPISSPISILPNGGWVGRGKIKQDLQEIVIVGDPDFQGVLPQLEGARVEATRVGKLYKTPPLLGASASDRSLRRSVGNGARILHIATHAEFNARQPLKSSLYLSGENGADALTAGAVFERPISAGLVVLSACETGVGKVNADDDFLGLPRSFYLAGAHTVLNSLWPVDDLGTLSFMTTFHQALEGGDIGKAWLAARNATKREGYPPSVYGAFVIGGALQM